MPCIPDVSEQYLELVHEHLHRFRYAFAVYFPDWASHLALIEIPGNVDYMPVDRRRVTDLLEFQRTEEVRFVDERQLDLLVWREVAWFEDCR